MTATPFTVSQVARLLTESTGAIINPRDVSNLLYDREVRDDLCPVVGGRRLVPSECVPLIEAALRRKGLIPRRGDA